MDEREPVAKENAMTPRIMITIAMPLSRVFTPDMSP